MAVSTFTGAGGAAGGANDFGGTLVGSFTGFGTPIIVDLDLAVGDYLITVKCPTESTVGFTALNPTTLDPISSIASITAAGENSKVVKISTAYSKVLITGLNGVAVFTLYDSPSAAASVAAGTPTYETFIPALENTTIQPSYFDCMRAVLESDTHYAFRNQPQAVSGAYGIMSKATKRATGLYTVPSQGATPRDYGTYTCKIGLKSNVALAHGTVANGGSNQIARFIHEEDADEWTCFSYEATGLVNAPWSSGPSYVSIVYMSHIDTFVATTSSDGYLYYSTDDGLTWSQGATCTASYMNLHYDVESQLLIIDTDGNTARSYFEYIADPTTGAATSWSYPGNLNSWYVPIYNAAGGFWVTARYASSSSTYVSTSTGGSWTYVSAASFPSGYTGQPVVAEGKVYVPNGDIRSSGLGMVYSADGTNWTSVNIQSSRWYQGYTDTYGQRYAIVDNGFIKWFGAYGGYCWDIANEEQWMSAPSFGIQYYLSSKAPGNKFICTNSSRYSASVDGHRWFGQAYTSFTHNARFFNGEFWIPTQNAYYGYAFAPNANGTWTVRQTPTNSSGYSAMGLVHAGDTYAVAPSASVSYSSGWTSDGGVTWTSINPFNRVTACFDGQFVGWNDSPNNWGVLTTSGSNIQVLDSSGNAFTSSTYAQGIPHKAGALLWSGGGTLALAYVDAAQAEVKWTNSINVASDFGWSVIGEGVLWEFAGTLFYDIMQYSTSRHQSRLRQAYSLDGGISWIENEVDANGYNRFYHAYPDYANNNDGNFNNSWHEGAGTWPVVLYSAMNDSYADYARAGKYAAYAPPRKLVGKVSAV